MLKSALDTTYKTARRIIITVIGFTLLLIGVVMLVTPGPGLAAMAGGLALLAVEFAWARAWLKKIRARISDAGQHIRGKSINTHRGE
ncbi:MAG: PGPGW domain-containing protein [Pseudomonadota bacterium]